MGEGPQRVGKSRTLRVTVPATSANLGAGFDVLGLALDLHNVFMVAQADEDKVEISGYGGGVPSDRSNLFYRAFKHLHDLSEKPTPTVHIRMELRVPP